MNFNNDIRKVFTLDAGGTNFVFTAIQKRKSTTKKIETPGTNKRLTYDPIPRLATATSRIGTSEARSLGANDFASKMN